MTWKDHRPKSIWRKEIKEGWYYHKDDINPFNPDHFTLDSGYVIQDNCLYWAVSAVIRLKGNENIRKDYEDFDTCVKEMTEIAKSSMATLVII